jgi:hypothetical protein
MIVEQDQTSDLSSDVFCRKLSVFRTNFVEFLFGMFFIDDLIVLKLLYQIFRTNFHSVVLDLV